MKGRLITLEGIDGSGKSTTAKYIVSRLSEMMPDRRIILTAEPTTGAVGNIIRESLSQSNADELPVKAIEELFLFMADHADHLSRLILPSLEAGAIVISDRYADSTAAYQGVTLNGIIPDPVQWIRGIYAPWNLLPDRTLFLSLDPGIAVQRMESRKGKEKFEKRLFLQSVDENFRRLAALEPGRFIIIDASMSAEHVANAALSEILDLLSPSI